MIRRSFAALVCSLAALAVSAPAHAQAYPTKPLKFVVGFPAGGPTDVIARLVAQDMSVSLGQPIVVENKTGANSLIATEFVASQTADGYTLLFASLSHNVNALLQPGRYDPLKDFVPVGNAAVLPLLVVTAATSPFNSVADIVNAARAKPEALSYGSAGTGGSAHLAGALLETSSNVKMTHVPFRGNAPALTEIIGGRMSFMFYPMIGIQDWVAQKKLKVLAIASQKRSPDYPNVPTMSEAGFKGFEETAPWVGMLAPKNTPPAVVNKLSEAMRQSLDKPETKERLRALGAITVGDTPAEFTKYLESDKERWARVIKAAGVKAE